MAILDLTGRLGDQTRREEAEHPLPALARHGAVHPALRAPGADPEHPAPGRPGAAVPQGVLRRADVLGLALRAAHGAVSACERDDGPGPPRLRALRLLAPHR